jgi:hypothetical protein
VARDLEKKQCGVIHVQPCWQCVPVIRAFNPTSKIVLHIHTEWFSRRNLAVVERRRVATRSCGAVQTEADHVTDILV